MFDLEITPEGRRSLGRLPRKVRDAVLALMFASLAENPRQVGKPLVGELAGLHSARRAEYRVVYEIVEARRVVVVHRVGHRRDVYRQGRAF